MTRSLRALMLMLVTSLFLSAAGCGASSKDTHTFASTVHQPTTLTLLDAHQQESIWEMDIPVNHKLVVNFENNVSENVNAMGEAESWADWKLYRSDDQAEDVGRKRKGKLIRSDRIELTGTAVRMHVTYRPGPELPGSLDAAPVPTVETAQSVADEAIAEAKAAGQAQPAATEEAVEETVEEAVEEEVEEAAEPAVEEAADEAAEAVEEAADEATK